MKRRRRSLRLPSRPRTLAAAAVALLVVLGGVPLDRMAVANAQPLLKRCTNPTPKPTHQNVQYDQVGSVPLYLDVFEPGVTRGLAPALLILHSGGWHRGCKGEVASEGARAAAEEFVAFVIDVRLACDPLRPPADIDDVLLCGYHATDPVDDVLTATRWIRENALTYGADPNRLAALGFSSGGNLVLMAAATGLRGDTAPDVVAGWSPMTELGYLPNGTVTCTESNNPTACTNTVANYVGCPLESCPDDWAAASPYSFVTPGDPPVFVANATRELIPLDDALAYQSRLQSVGVAEQLCVVNGRKHARQYEDTPCHDSGITVWNETMAFLLAQLSVRQTRAT